MRHESLYLQSRPWSGFGLRFRARWVGARAGLGERNLCDRLPFFDEPSLEDRVKIEGHVAAVDGSWDLIGAE
jgi:hypothetical protein